MKPELLDEIQNILLPEGRGFSLTITDPGTYLYHARGWKEIVVMKNGTPYMVSINGPEEEDGYVQVSGYLKCRSGDVISTTSDYGHLAVTKLNKG